MFRETKGPAKLQGEKQVQSSKGLMGTGAGSPGHTKWWWWGGTDTHAQAITSAGGHRDSRGRGWTPSHKEKLEGGGWENG